LEDNFSNSLFFILYGSKRILRYLQKDKNKIIFARDIEHLVFLWKNDIILIDLKIMVEEYILKKY